MMKMFRLCPPKYTKYINQIPKHSTNPIQNCEWEKSYQECLGIFVFGSLSFNCLTPGAIECINKEKEYACKYFIPRDGIQEFTVEIGGQVVFVFLFWYQIFSTLIVF